MSLGYVVQLVHRPVGYMYAVQLPPLQHLTSIMNVCIHSPSIISASSSDALVSQFRNMAPFDDYIDWVSLDKIASLQLELDAIEDIILHRGENLRLQNRAVEIKRDMHAFILTSEWSIGIV